MNLSSLLAARSAEGRPVRVGLIGAGKFGSMVLAQAQRIRGYHVVAVADLNVGKARESLARVGWPEERYGAKSAGEAVRKDPALGEVRFKALSEWAEAGRVRPNISHRLPLEDYAKAMRLLIERKAIGRVALMMQ